MTRTAAVAIGGLVGSVARYWLTGWAQRLSGSDFPVGTLAVNLLGSLLIGAAIALSVERGAFGISARLLLVTGFCGGFTTMSAFSFETFALLRDGHTLFALVNVGGTFAGCLLAVWLGIALGRLA